MSSQLMELGRFWGVGLLFLTLTIAMALIIMIATNFSFLWRLAKNETRRSRASRIVRTSLIVVGAAFGVAINAFGGVLIEDFVNNLPPRASKMLLYMFSPGLIGLAGAGVATCVFTVLKKNHGVMHRIATVPLALITVAPLVFWYRTLFLGHSESTYMFNAILLFAAGLVGYMLWKIGRFMLVEGEDMKRARVAARLRARATSVNHPAHAWLEGRKRPAS